MELKFIDGASRTFFFLLAFSMMKRAVLIILAFNECIVSPSHHVSFLVVICERSGNLPGSSLQINQ